MSRLDAEQSATESSAPGRTAREESVDDFSPEWCQKLLNDPLYQHSSPVTRAVGGSNGQSYNSLIGKTLFTDNTLRAMRFLYKPGDRTKGTSGELVALISIGSEMCSHTGVLHGGINTTIVDEVAGGLAVREASHNLMAVNFNINLRKSVKAPGLILGRAWIDRPPQGRKVWVKCVLEQDGVTCIDSESLFLKVNMGGKL